MQLTLLALGATAAAASLAAPPSALTLNEACCPPFSCGPDVAQCDAGLECVSTATDGAIGGMGTCQPIQLPAGAECCPTCGPAVAQCAAGLTCVSTAPEGTVGGMGLCTAPTTTITATTTAVASTPAVKTSRARPSRRAGHKQ